MERGSVFMTNGTQGVRFPKSMRLPDGVTNVDIQRSGSSWIITPSEHSWAAWFEGEGVSSDFMAEPDLHDQEPDASASPLSAATDRLLSARGSHAARK
jgi:antitoxin VapB